jgi:hypothetical protein
MSSVFISGSIAIKKLPSSIEDSINRIKEQNIKILVGDAGGVDTKVQEYCQKINYYNVTVYSIYRTPRNKINDRFEKKYIIVEGGSNKERERQKEKDGAMTIDSEYSLVIWDSKSRGSYSNIIRAINNNKKTKVYLNKNKYFIHQKDVNKNNIEFIYRETNGYKATEVIDYLNNNGSNFFKTTQSFNKWLLTNNIIKKEEKTYIPMEDYKNLLIEDRYRGRITGVKFKNEFIEWIENKIGDIKQPVQPNMF